MLRAQRGLLYENHRLFDGVCSHSLRILRSLPVGILPDFGQLHAQVADNLFFHRGQSGIGISAYALGMLFFHKIHIIFKVSFSQNSHFQNLIFLKILIFKITFFSKFIISKSHFSQNSHFQNLIFHQIHILFLAF